MWGINVQPPDHAPPTLVRLLRIVLTFAVGGWLFSAATMLDDGVMAALSCETAARGCGVAVLFGLLSCWVLATFSRWYIGAIIATAIAPLAIYLHFTLWPVESWKLTTDKATMIVLSSYWEYLLPITIIGGSFSVWWSQQPAWLQRGTHEEPEAG